MSRRAAFNKQSSKADAESSLEVREQSRVNIAATYALAAVAARTGQRYLSDKLEDEKIHARLGEALAHGYPTRTSSSSFPWTSSRASYSRTCRTKREPADRSAGNRSAHIQWPEALQCGEDGGEPVVSLLGTVAESSEHSH